MISAVDTNVILDLLIRGAPQAAAACGPPARMRGHALADFLIGAPATIHSDRPLTRDRGYYATYFPDLELA